VCRRSKDVYAQGDESDGEGDVWILGVELGEWRVQEFEDGITKEIGLMRWGCYLSERLVQRD
jgi:hypothetical protein